MGKKKSVVLMVLLTIVIVVLCAVAMFPVFTLPGTSGVKDWNPAVMQYDLSADLGGGYYAYYYPEGVITQAEFESNGEDANKYLQHKGLYLSKDEDAGLVDAQGNVDEEFKTAFNAAAKTMADRFAKKGYSDYRVSVVDDYALRVEIPSSAYDKDNADVDKMSAVLSSFGNMGALTLKSGGEVVSELQDENTKLSDLIKKVTVGTRYKMAFLKIHFTSAGKTMVKGLKDKLSDAPTNSTTDTSSLTSLDIMIGDGEEAFVSMYKDNFMSGNGEAQVYFVEQANKDLIETYAILLNSALAMEGLDVTFNIGSVRAYEPVYGENVLKLLYIALAIVLVAIIILPIVKMGRFGVVSGYLTLSYVIVTTLCFAFMLGGVFEVTLGTVFTFLVFLAIMNVMQLITYNAIVAELKLHKTAESSVKLGYNKTLGNTVDVYAVLLLGALALLIGVAGLNALAIQAIVCVVTAAFCNLLWGRVINFTLFSASQDKYKYFRFVREDDDDE